MSKSADHYSKVKARLDSVGKGFCLAKWTHISLHLQHGVGHSCYHPKPHKIPLDEIKRDPSALHNTTFKKQQRGKMLSNERPSECEYCWKVEDLGEERISDRIIHSDSEWSMPYFDEILSAGQENNINPRYLEVSFGFECNLKCIYCMPTVSSKWFSEIKKYGNYNLSIDHYYVSDEDLNDKKYADELYNNPYIEAFWRWWPSLCEDLLVFRITGGEPLINNNTFKIMDDLIGNPKPNLEFSINSNFSVPDHRFESFIDKVKTMLSKKSVKGIVIYTSAEGVGDRAEYQRNGLDFVKFEKNVKRFLAEVDNAALSFMCTFNLLSASSYIEFLKWYEELKNEYPGRIFMDVNSVSYVNFLDMSMITPELKIKMKECYEFMERSESFEFVDRNKMKTLYEKVENSTASNEDLLVRFRDFYIFITEYDKRNGKDFLKTFPEYRDIYIKAEQAFNKIIAV